MADMTWEKTIESAGAARSRLAVQRRYGYMILFVLMMLVVGYLGFKGMIAGGRYYMTVDEVLADSGNVGKNIRVAGAVDGTTIDFDTENQILTFTIVNIPNDGDAIREAGGLGAVLHQALQNPDASRMMISWENAEMPDLLQHEAQAIVTGELGADGVFYANQVLLKCPTKYSDEVPEQTTGSES